MSPWWLLAVPVLAYVFRLGKAAGREEATGDLVDMLHEADDEAQKWAQDARRKMAAEDERELRPLDADYIAHQREAGPNQ